MPLTPEQRSMRARMAALARWSRADATRQAQIQAKIGQDALLAKFADEIDPDQTMDPGERYRLAVRRRRLHMVDLAFRSSKARSRTAPGEDAA